MFGILAVIWVDILKIKSKGLSSMFALGGAGTFALTLASQDLAKRALNGVAIAASDIFHVGDSILLGDGKAACHVRILSTLLNAQRLLTTKCLVHRYFWVRDQHGVAQHGNTG